VASGLGVPHVSENAFGLSPTENRFTLVNKKFMPRTKTMGARKRVGHRKDIIVPVRKRTREEILSRFLEKRARRVYNRKSYPKMARHHNTSRANATGNRRRIKQEVSVEVSSCTDKDEDDYSISSKSSQNLEEVEQNELETPNSQYLTQDWIEIAFLISS